MLSPSAACSYRVFLLVACGPAPGRLGVVVLASSRSFTNRSLPERAAVQARPKFNVTVMTTGTEMPFKRVAS